MAEIQPTPVPTSVDLTDADKGTKLSLDEVADYLATQYHENAGEDIPVGLYKIIAAHIPQTMWYSDHIDPKVGDRGSYVGPLRHLDIRPIIQKLLADTSLDAETKGKLTKEMDYAQQFITGSVLKNAAAAKLTDQQQQALTTSVADSYKDGQLRQISLLDPDKVTQTQVATNPATGEPILQTSVTDDTGALNDDPFGSLLEDKPPTPFTQQTALNVFRASSGSLFSEQNLNVGDSTNPVPLGDVLQVSGLQTERSDVANARGADKPLSASEALQFLYHRTPEEIHAWELKMRAAGYYDRVGDAPTFTGDAHEDANRKAWNLLLSDAALSAKPVDQMLAEQTQKFTDHLRATNQVPAFDEQGRPTHNQSGEQVRYDDKGVAIPTTNANGEQLFRTPDGSYRTQAEIDSQKHITALTDPNQIAYYGNTEAQKLLKRDLNPAEVAYLVDTIHQTQVASTAAFDATAPGGSYTDVDPRSMITTLISLLAGPDGKVHDGAGFISKFGPAEGYTPQMLDDRSPAFPASELTPPRKPTMAQSGSSRGY